SGRPVRHEAVFDAHACGTAPAVFLGRIERRAGCGAQTGVLVAGDGSAALDVKQRVIPGIADLAGDQAEGVDLRAVAGAGCQQADIAAAQPCPVALALDAEHKGAGLPAIADLAACHAPAGIMATFRRQEGAADTGVGIPAFAASAPSPVGAE